MGKENKRQKLKAKQNEKHKWKNTQENIKPKK